MTETIEKWENIEVERSASEARKKTGADLRVGADIIERYREPPADTPYPLEYAYHLLGKIEGKTVLDYGCGAGENSVLIASRGGKAVGVDISPELLEIAEQRLALHGFGDKAEFKIGSAHRLPLENESVDVVFGMAILHHLDLSVASKEVHRVLKKSGEAIFLEPVRNSKFVSFVRNMIPYQAADVSPFERPLTDAELEEFAGDFSAYESRAFSLPFVNLIQVLRLPDKFMHRAIGFDGKLLKKFKPLNYYASIRVIRLVK